MKLAGLFEKPHAFFTGHALVGHQQADFVLVLDEHLEALLGARGRQDAKLLAEGARKVLQRFFFVIHVEDREFPVIKKRLHS